MADKRDVAVWYAKRFVLMPYEWGDEDFSGIDCSGLACEMLRSVGILGNNEDLTAHSLYRRFEAKRVDTPRPGCLAFYGAPDRIIHVAICIDETHVLTASGGGSTVTNPAEADKKNAFVKVRPMRYWSAFVCVVDPFEE